MTGFSFVNIQHFIEKQEKDIVDPNNEYARDVFSAVNKLSDIDVLAHFLIRFLPPSSWQSLPGYSS
jgi:hypothetical protein